MSQALKKIFPPTTILVIVLTTATVVLDAVQSGVQWRHAIVAGAGTALITIKSILVKKGLNTNENDATE